MTAARYPGRGKTSEAERHLASPSSVRSEQRKGKAGVQGRGKMQTGQEEMKLFLFGHCDIPVVVFLIASTAGFLAIFSESRACLLVCVS